LAHVRFLVDLLQLRRLLRVDMMPCFAQQCVNQQAAAHADAAVNTPHCELDPGLFQGFPPCQHVLVDAIDESSIEIE
jgi:hypothetical protein